MRFGIDGTCWWNRRGFGRFTRGLLQALFALPSPHRYCLFVDREPEPEMLRENVDVVKVNQSRPVTEAAVASSNRSVRDLLRFSFASMREELDLMFFPAVYSWFPAPPSVPTVVTLHDAIAEHYPELTLPNRWRRLLWSLKLRVARLQAARFITVSSAAREEIVRYLGIREGLIDVISEAPDPLFRRVEHPAVRAEVRQKLGLPTNGRILVYVGGLAPHKNLDGLISGFAKARAGLIQPDIHLALVGDTAGDGFHSHYEHLLSRVSHDQRLNGCVHFTGYVSDDDLAAVYSDALAVVLPSFSEGFGLPALEAIACGTPVLASDTASLPEVLGDAALYFDPKDSTDIATCIMRIANDPGVLERLRPRTLVRAAQFTWDRAAEMTSEILERCARNS